MRKQDTYTIRIPKLKLFGYHGCYDEEKEKGQEFEIEVEITITPSDIDRLWDEHINPLKLEDMIDYSEVENKIKHTFNIRRYDLLEQLAAEISAAPYGVAIGRQIHSEITSVSVTIRKNNPMGMSVPYIELKYINYNE